VCVTFTCRNRAGNISLLQVIEYKYVIQYESLQRGISSFALASVVDCQHKEGCETWHSQSELMDESNPGRKSLVPNLLLREERERRNWTQKDVAVRINLPNARTVGRWDRGYSFPSPHFRLELCRIFETSAEELGLVKRTSGERGQPPVLSERSQKPEPLWKMPLTFTSFIGREQEVDAVESILKCRVTRLLPWPAATGCARS